MYRHRYIFYLIEIQFPPQSELFTFIFMKLRSKSMVSQWPRLLSSTTKAVNCNFAALAAINNTFTFSFCLKKQL